MIILPIQKLAVTVAGGSILFASILVFEFYRIHKRLNHLILSSPSIVSDLKVGFSECKVDNVPQFDVIVIGSGISGLTCANLLSRQGKRVLILEQHDIIGGCCHTFVDKGFEFDTGLHYVGGLVGCKKSLFGFLFNILSLGKLTWQKMQNEYDKIIIKESLKGSCHDSDPSFVKTFSMSSSNLATHINNKFHENKQNISNYYYTLKLAEKSFLLCMILRSLPEYISNVIRKYISPWFIDHFINQSTSHVIKSCIQNDECIGALAWCWGDYGVPPHQSPFMMHAGLVTHFLDGAFYPNGGPSAITKTFLHTIIGSGGKAFVRAPVSRIILNETGTQALGVTVRGKDIFAPAVISAVGVINTFCRLIPVGVQCHHAERVRKHIRLKSKSTDGEKLAKLNCKVETEELFEKVHEYGTNSDASPTPLKSRELEVDSRGNTDLLEPSCSMFSVFIGLKGSPSELGLSSQNYWCFPSWNHEKSWKLYQHTLSECRDLSDEGAVNKIHLPVVFMGSSSAKDGEWNARYPDVSVFELLTVADFSLFLDLDPKMRTLGNERPSVSIDHQGGDWNDTGKSENALDHPATAVMTENECKREGEHEGDMSSSVRGKPGHRGDKYALVKADMQARLMEIFFEEFPHLKDRVVYVTSGTPLSNNFYLGSAQGEVYGLTHSKARFSGMFDWLLRPEQPIGGLYLTGQDIVSDGICGALIAGVVTSISVSKMVFLDLFASYFLSRLYHS